MAQLWGRPDAFFRKQQPTTKMKMPASGAKWNQLPTSPALRPTVSTVLLYHSQIPGLRWSPQNQDRHERRVEHSLLQRATHKTCAVRAAGDPQNTNKSSLHTAAILPSSVRLLKISSTALCKNSHPSVPARSLPVPTKASLAEF